MKGTLCLWHSRAVGFEHQEVLGVLEACFKEYQIYVVSRLISLQKLDDCVITT